MGNIRPLKKIQAETPPAPASAPGKPLKALVVEDSEEDTILLINELRRGGYEPSFTRVDTAEEMAAALESQEWDIVLADYVMPRFSGLAALFMLKEKGVELPLVMVSGKIGEDALLEAMKAGAHDYIVKDRLGKVVPAVERGLEDSAVRKEKKRAEAALKSMAQALEKSEARFRDLVETTSDWIWEVDENGLYTYASPKVRDILGYGPEEVLGRAPWELMPKDEAARVSVLFGSVLKEKRPFSLLENINLHKDGHEVAIETSGTPFFDSSGAFRGYKGIDRDVTERRQAQKKLAAMSRLNAVLSGINKAIIRTQSRDKLFLECCRIAVERGSFKLAWVGLVDKEAGLIRPAASWGQDEGYLKESALSGDGEACSLEPAGCVIRKGEHFICADILNDPRMPPWRDEALKRGFRSCAAFPIRSGAHILGALSVYSDKAEFCDHDDIALLDELADDVSFGIQTIELEEQRRRADEALKSEAAVSEALLKAAEITTASLNWDSIAESVLGLLKQLVACDDAAIIMLDSDGTLLPRKRVGSSAEPGSFFFTHHARISEIEALAQVVATKKPVVIKKEDLCFLMPDFYAKNLELKNLIIAPIIAGARVIGFLGTNFDRLPADPRASAIIHGMAGQLGAAYESANLYEETQRKGLDLAKKMEALKVLHEIDRMILSTLDREEMLSRVVLQIKRLLPADVGYVAMLDSEKTAFTYRCGWGMAAKKGDILPAKGHPGYDTVKSGKTLLRANLSEEAGFSPMDRATYDLGIRSDMFVPIFSKGAGVGVIRLGSCRVAGFSLDDTATAEKLAYQIGIAWENSRLIADLEGMLICTVTALSSAIDAKSPWTKGHSERVTSFAVQIAEKLGLPGHELEKIRLAGLLHDIGKIGTLDAILDKPDTLTEEEFGLVMKHPDRGCEILGPIKQFKDILPAIRHHHERYDGQGYPAGLKGEEIPLAARILAVADSFDSMTADRPYRPSPGTEYAISEFKRCSGTQFDPRVVEAFLKVLGE